MDTPDQIYFHPEEPENIIYWSRKFGVTMRQLKEAILDTGTLEIKPVKEYLRRDSYIYHPIKGAKLLFARTLAFIF